METQLVNRNLVKITTGLEILGPVAKLKVAHRFFSGGVHYLKLLFNPCVTRCSVTDDYSASSDNRLWNASFVADGVVHV